MQIRKFSAQILLLSMTLMVAYRSAEASESKLRSGAIFSPSRHKSEQASSDCYYTQQLYRAVTADKYARLPGMIGLNQGSTSDQCCSSAGVSCDVEHRVTGIDWSLNRLNHQFPTGGDISHIGTVKEKAGATTLGCTVRCLPHLSSLNLHGQPVQGSIPDFRLTKVRSLDLGETRMSPIIPRQVRQVKWAGVNTDEAEYIFLVINNGQGEEPVWDDAGFAKGQYPGERNIDLQDCPPLQWIQAAGEAEVGEGAQCPGTAPLYL